MSSLRPLAAAALLAALAVQPLRAETAAAPADTKPVNAPKPATEEKPAASTATTAAPEKKKFTKAQIEAFLTKCSVEADEKGLTKAKNKLAERKAFRRTCMSKFGVEPKSAKDD